MYFIIKSIDLLITLIIIFLAQDNQVILVALWFKQEDLIQGGVFISRSGRAVSYVMSETQCIPHDGIRNRALFIQRSLLFITGPSVGICCIPA